MFLKMANDALFSTRQDVHGPHDHDQANSLLLWAASPCQRPLVDECKGSSPALYQKCCACATFKSATVSYLWTSYSCVFVRCHLLYQFTFHSEKTLRVQSFITQVRWKVWLMMRTLGEAKWNLLKPIVLVNFTESRGKYRTHVHLVYDLSMVKSWH